LGVGRVFTERGVLCNLWHSSGANNTLFIGARPSQLAASHLEKRTLSYHFASTQTDCEVSLSPVLHCLLKSACACEVTMSRRRLNIFAQVAALSLTSLYVLFHMRFGAGSLKRVQTVDLGSYAISPDGMYDANPNHATIPPC
jgi:hypothetical protein